MLLKALPAWLSLARDERARIAGEAFAAALQDAGVRHRHFDAEAFSGGASDVAMFETDDLRAYYFAIERLRDTPIFARPYFEVVQILPCIEDGYRAFEAGS
jgi:hypothetical protein